MNSASGKTTVGVVIASSVYRESLREMLIRSPELEPVDLGDGSAVSLSLIRRSRSHVALVGLPSIELPVFIREARRVAHDTSILVIENRESDSVLLSLVRAGASGTIPPDAGVTELLSAIQRAARGEPCFSTRAGTLLLRASRATHSSRASSSPLTQREGEVFDLLGLGYSNKEIGDVLGVGIGTVKSHVHGVLSKLGLTRRSQVAAGSRGGFSARITSIER